MPILLIVLGLTALACNPARFLMMTYDNHLLCVYMENESFEALEHGFKKLSVSVPLYRIVRDDLQEDAITKLRFSCYDKAYDELERFYGDLCCSDERIEYSIVPI